MDNQSDGSGEATASDVTSTPAQASDVTSDPALQEGCTGTPCPFENECRSEYGFCGTSFIYCNMLSSWTLEKCGLLGIDASGETHLCDVEVFECSTGEAVHRNPEGCEYFPCPSVEEESAAFTSIFNVPAPSPFPPLPKPTLPTITKPTSQSSSAFLPAGTTLTSSSESDSSNSLAILLGDNNQDEAVDDTASQEEDDLEESDSLTSTNDAITKPVSPSYDFGSFKADEWLFSHSAHDRYDWKCQLLVSLFTVQLLIIYN